MRDGWSADMTDSPVVLANAGDIKRMQAAALGLPTDWIEPTLSSVGIDVRRGLYSVPRSAVGRACTVLQAAGRPGDPLTELDPLVGAPPQIGPRRGVGEHEADLRLLREAAEGLYPDQISQALRMAGVDGELGLTGVPPSKVSAACGMLRICRRGGECRAG
jgi:hypothetical protein